MKSPKIDYLYLNEGNVTSGVTKKVLAQIKAIKQLGIQCQLTVGSTESFSFPEDIQRKETRLPHIRKKTDALRYFRATAKILEGEVSSLGADEILYIRGLPATPWAFNVLKKQRKCKVVCEVQSKSINEQPICVSSILEWIIARPIRKHIDAFVTVTEEIRLYEQYLFPKKTPSLCIPNGIDVNSVSMRSVPPRSGALRLLCVARFNKHHGIDRVLPLLMNDKSNITLEMVGDGPGMPSIKLLAEKLGVIDKCIFSGKLHGNQLDECFNRTDVAIGALALHKLELTECASLKHREYCARGIPFIYAGKDPDFPTSFKYAKMIPLNDNPLKIDDIQSFAKFMGEESTHPAEMRKYAAEHLSWSTKMQLLHNFLKTL